MSVDIIEIMDHRTNGKEISEILGNIPKEELLLVFKRIVDNDPFICSEALAYLIEKLYADEEEFVKILCKLIHSNYTDFAFNQITNHIFEKARANPEITINIAKIIDNVSDMKPGLCSGIIKTPLLGENLIDKEICLNLESEDLTLQFQSLIAIFGFFRISKNKNLFVSHLVKTAKNIDEDNSEILIQCLSIAYHNNKSVYSTIKEEIETRGYIAAKTFINTIRCQDDSCISLLETAVQIVSSETPNHNIVDAALAKIYEKDPNFVVNKIHDRIYTTNRPVLADVMLASTIQSNPTPVIEMLEKEMDTQNHTIRRFGGDFLRDFLKSDHELLVWCKKWKDDKTKMEVILRSLGMILTTIMDRDPYEDNTDRNDAIELVKEIACKNEINYETETKGFIDLGKDSHEGAENKTDTIKALHVIKKILYPPGKIDTEVLKRNLDSYPNICEAIGKKWLLSNAKSKKPHDLAYIYNREPNYSRIKELAEELESENDENRKIAISWLLDGEKDVIFTQIHWEKVFETLKKYGLYIPKRKLRNPSDSESILTEAEVIARLAPHFNVQLEPIVKELLPKKLDALIKDNNESALIEIATVHERVEMDVAEGAAIMIPGGKVKGVILSKFKGQLHEGKVNPKIPVILILKLSGLNNFDAENAIYGEAQIYHRSTDDGLVVEKGMNRGQNSFYHEKNSNIITAIATYNSDYSRESFIGKLHRPPRNIIPLNSMSNEFRVKIRNALFEDTADSGWSSLTKIDGISHKIAKELYNNGIDDLGVLANLNDDDINIQGFELEQMKEWRAEAIRIIYAISSSSIRFIKGVDQRIFDMLMGKKIVLITQLLGLKEIPEGINETEWAIIINDAKQIME